MFNHQAEHQFCAKHHGSLLTPSFLYVCSSGDVDTDLPYLSNCCYFPQFFPSLVCVFSVFTSCHQVFLTSFLSSGNVFKLNCVQRRVYFFMV